MKFAIISDVHGNLPALNAVIEDAEKKNVDSYIFVGDYCLSNPFPNGCITRIRNIADTYMIRGNEESYLENLIGKDQSTWVDGQMQISYWCYKNISSENLNYLLSARQLCGKTYVVILEATSSSMRYLRRYQMVSIFSVTHIFSGIISRKMGKKC